jgi:hypothetical protein
MYFLPFWYFVPRKIWLPWYRGPQNDNIGPRFVDLAEFAEHHIDDEDAPLFLRFVNLLINDAIYLLVTNLISWSQILFLVNKFYFLQESDGHS